MLMRNILVSILAGVLIHSCIGTIQCWGELKLQIASYQRHKGHPVSADSLDSGFDVMLFSLFSSQFLTPFLFQRVNYRAVLLAGAVVISAGTQVSIQCECILTFMWVQCLSLGLGSGLVQMVPLMCSWELQPTRIGFVTGVVIGALGISSLLCNFLITAIINPNSVVPQVIQNSGSLDKFYPVEVAETIPYQFNVISCIQLAFLTIGAILCHRKTKLERDRIQKFIKQNSEFMIYESQQQSQHKNLIFTSDQVFSKSFIIPFILNAITIQTGLFVVNNYHTVGVEQQNYSHQQLSGVGYIGSILNFLSRLILAIVVENMGYKFGYTFVILVQLFMLILMLIEVDFIYFVASAILFFPQGAHYTQTAVQYSELHGAILGGKIYGIFVFSFLLSVVSNIGLNYQYFFQGFQYVLQILILLNLIGLAILQNFEFELFQVKNN